MIKCLDLSTWLICVYRLLQTLFPILVNTPSKSLRAVLYQRIVSDLRSANSKSTSHRLNRMIQTVLYNLISSDPTSPKGVWAVKITRELWRRQVWTDSKAVEIMKEAALADSEKVIIGGVRFFLGGDKEREETLGESSGEEDAVDLDRIRHQMGVNKKTARKEKELKRIAATVKKVGGILSRGVPLLTKANLYRKSAKNTSPIR